MITEKEVKAALELELHGMDGEWGTLKEANARLIAAAPEMLGALIEIYKAQYGKNKTLANLNSTIRKSKRIIEKATGQILGEEV